MLQLDITALAGIVDGTVNMSNSTNRTEQDNVVQLKATASLMTFDAGLFCVFISPEQSTTMNGYPAVTVTQAPNMPTGVVSIKTFDDGGGISGHGTTGAGAALVRVSRGPAQIMVTTYQVPDSTLPPPGIQVARLSAPPQPGEAVSAQESSAPQDGVPSPEASATAEVAAHIQRRGDIVAKIGEWMGEPDSQKWIEGFSIAPKSLISPEDIEYQAVLGKGWLSPWAEAGQYCGSRGMALPILGLCIRLKKGQDEAHDLAVQATFTDGTKIGPVASGEILEAESLAPLEAFRIEISSRTDGAKARKKRGK